MPKLYHALFHPAGTRQFALAGLLARIPLPMSGIGIITMLSQLRGSYALAGLVAATFVVTYALLSPQISALVDRHGQHCVLPVATIISLTGLLLLPGAVSLHLPDWVLFVAAVLAGFMPSMSAMVRARWTTLYRGQPQLQTAYALETVFDEVTFIVGPPLSVGLCVALFPQAGLIVAAVVLLTGVSAFVIQRKTEPPVTTELARPRSRSVLGMPHVWVLTLLMIAMGMIVGTVDIVSVAFAEQLGQPGAAAVVLSAYAIGSCVAGLVFGALTLATPLPRLLLLGGLLTSATTLPFLFVGSITTLSMTVLVAGLFFAPTMIVAMSLTERLVPAHQLTEGMTWLLAGLNIGVASGAAVSGQLVDAYDAHTGFVTALCAGMLVLGAACLGYWRLRGEYTPTTQRLASD